MKYLLNLLFLTTVLIGQDIQRGNVVFIHPDGTGLTSWNAARILYYGPDSQLNWDKLSNMALYRIHMKDCLTSSSHAGGTVHSYGIKVALDSYGLDRTDEITARSGKRMSIMHEAVAAGYRTGLVNSGSIIEPGSSAFVAKVQSRKMDEEIAKQVIHSGVDLLFSGGEEWFLPKGEQGFHCTGKRTDGINLIEIAEELGYKVIYTRDELFNLPTNTKKVLGIFSEGHTFNSYSEEVIKDLNFDGNYKQGTPTLAEMTASALRILSNDEEKQFFLVIEEEGTDNFGNNNNASGTLEALKRADDAIGIVIDFQKKNDKTLLITAADSEASSMELIGIPLDEFEDGIKTPPFESNGAPIDGVDGSKSDYFLSAPDANGNRLPFYICWGTKRDGYGSVIARTNGLNAELLPQSVDNTDIYRIMYATLFGVWLD